MDCAPGNLHHMLLNPSIVLLEVIARDNKRVRPKLKANEDDHDGGEEHCLSTGSSIHPERRPDIGVLFFFSKSIVTLLFNRMTLPGRREDLIISLEI